MERIDIIAFLKSFKILADSEYTNILVEWESQKAEIQEFWMSNPDLRLTQVLINYDIMPNVLGTWYQTEETDWMIEQGIVEFDEIHFWGVNYTASGKKLSKTVYKPLKDLTDDHIVSIIKWFKDRKIEDSMNSTYRAYFEKRIKNSIPWEQQMENEIKSILGDSN